MKKPVYISIKPDNFFHFIPKISLSSQLGIYVVSYKQKEIYLHLYNIYFILQCPSNTKQLITKNLKTYRVSSFVYRKATCPNQVNAPIFYKVY